MRKPLARFPIPVPSLTPVLSRRTLVAAVGAGAVVTLQGYGGNEDGGDASLPSPPSPASSNGEDFASRFAAFAPADEPNGDLNTVVWPDFVLAAGPEVKRLYEFQVVNGDPMRYMPCFCGCGGEAGHHNNRDCYIRQVGDDGSVILDSMAPT